MDARFLCFFALSFVISVAQNSDVEFRIFETNDIGFLIGNVRSYVNPPDHVADSELRYSILTEGNEHSSLFDINNGGNLTVKAEIDRETICPFAINCNVYIEIAVTATSAFFRNLKVKIVIKDVNDNAPQFPVTSRNLDILESSPIGTTFSLPGPTDSDMDPVNSLQSVEITDSTMPFGVNFSKNLDGTSSVELSVTRSLDRETVPFYNMKLLAKDGGNPIRSSTMDLNIRITDFNDNAPVFSHAIYNVTINETTLVGIVIVQVTATDKDEGKNGELFYRLSQHQSTADSFSMDNITGNMVLRKQLESGHIQVIVEAIDFGIPSKKSQAFVEIDVLDNINNKPKITVNIFSGSNQAEVKENVRKGHPIAHIRISDPDTGPNGIVACKSETQGFDLVPLSEEEYTAVVDMQLDYEETSSYTVKIFCQDGGTPKLTATAEFVVHVTDENDNTPEFIESDVSVNIVENNEVHAMIYQLAATDKDSGVNKKLTFSLTNEANVNFTVQQNFPIVRTKIKLDREDMAQYVFNVFAVDGGTPARTATATVTINVIDINDERPAFWKQAYEFHVRENRPIGQGVGNVSAFDLDTGEGGKFSLSLAPLTQTDHMPFTVLQNGTIISTDMLDREVTSQYIFHAIATDHGTQPLTGIAQVTVVIDDENDNDPSFVFPNDVNYSVSVFIPAKSGSIVVRIQGEDADSGANAEILFHAKDMNSSGLFRINKTSGEIYVTRDINANMIGTYLQLVTISNTEPNAKSVSQRLKIVVTNRPVEEVTGQRNDQYMVIVIVLVCATVFIAAGTLVAVCYIRKRDKDRQLKNVYEQETSSYGVANPVSEVDGVTLSDKSVNGNVNYTKPEKKSSDHDTSTSTVNGQIISTVQMTQQKVPKDVRPLRVNSEQVIPDREHQRKNQLMSFRLHQALQRLNSETSSQENSKIMASNAKVLEWREAQRRADDFHSTSSGEVTTGDSGHGSDEDSHIISERSAPTQKICLGVSGFKSRPQTTQGVPPRSKVSPIKGTKPPGGRNVPVIYASHFNLPANKNSIQSRGFNSYVSQVSPRSEVTDDVDDTTTSGSYSITTDDLKSELHEFDYVPVKDVYV